MSELGLDLNNVFGTQQAEKVASNTTNKKAGSDLVMDDFLKLMVAQFQNQSIDSTADTTEMMNQMVQMSVIQAITNLSTLVTDSTNLSYAASLVGKDVTIGERVGSKVEQVVGTVTGTGTLDGKQVLFLNGKDTPYDIADILAVGSIPKSIPKTGTLEEQIANNSSPWTTNPASQTNSQTTQTSQTAEQQDVAPAETAEQAGEQQQQNTAPTDTESGAASEARDPRVPDEDGALG